ncbi:hypothetical protein J6590_054180 [Homalodisca vitripennis]|nr:hypothetical protein J6590_054180 [Homalodisca vitripennis]
MELMWLNMLITLLLVGGVWRGTDESKDCSWMREHRLQLALQKMGAVVISGRKGFLEKMIFSVKGFQVVLKTAIMYLRA